MRRHVRIFFDYFVVVLLLGISFQALAISKEDLAEKVRGTIGTYYQDEFDISVPSDGHVVIEGQVNTLYDRYRIFDIVAKIPEVRAITDNLVVNTELLADDIIKTNIRNELYYVSSILDPDRININVDNGIVTLSGTVSFNREKLMAKTVTSWQKGVKSIINKIEVLPPEKAKSDENLRDVLQAILDNNFSTEENVSFTVKNGVVTLSGTTDNLWSKIEIEKEFSDVIGVRKVTNNLEVKPLSG